MDAYWVKKSKTLLRLDVSALYNSVYRHLVQETVVNFFVCTSNILENVPPVALKVSASYSGLPHLGHDQFWCFMSVS